MNNQKTLSPSNSLDNFKGLKIKNEIVNIKLISLLVLLITIGIVYLREGKYSIKITQLSEIQTSIIYLLVIIISAGMMYFATKIEKINILGGLGLVLPSLLTSLRYQVGSDYFTYQKLYLIEHNRIDWNFKSLIFEKEWLYLLFCRTLPSSAVTTALIGSLTLLLAFYAIQRFLSKEDIALAYFLYLTIFFFQSFNIQRQYLAISFFMVAVSYLFSGKRLVYLVFILLAIGFHQSAMITLLLLFFIDKNGEIKTWILKSRFLFYFILLVGIAFLSAILSLVPIFNNYLHYFEPNNAQQNIDNSSFIIYGCLFLYGLLIGKINKSKKVLFYSILITIGIILSLTGFQQQFIKRAALYFFCFEPIFIAEEISKLSLRKKRVFYLISVMIGAILFIGIYLYRNTGGVCPYRFF